jgi:hypothetical protein
LGQRIVAANRPDLLSDTERHRWSMWLRDRVLNEDVVPWLTIPAAREEIATIQEVASMKEREQLATIEQFLREMIRVAPKP